MMARSPSLNMPIASALTAKPFTDGSVLARSRVDSASLTPRASGTSTPTTPLQACELRCQRGNTVTVQFQHLNHNVLVLLLLRRGPKLTPSNLRQASPAPPLPPM